LLRHAKTTTSSTTTETATPTDAGCALCGESGDNRNRGKDGKKAPRAEVSRYGLIYARVGPYSTKNDGKNNNNQDQNQQSCVKPNLTNRPEGCKVNGPVLADGTLNVKRAIEYWYHTPLSLLGGAEGRLEKRPLGEDDYTPVRW